MARLEWGNPEDKLFELGVDRGVLNVHGTGKTCVPWNGLVSVEEIVPDAEQYVNYFDGVKTLNEVPSTDYEAIIHAMYSPPEFDQCDGTLDLGQGLFSSNNRPVKFNLSFRSMVGPRDYKIHIVYNALAVPTARNYSTLEGSVDLEPISWGITTQPVVTESGVYGAHHYLDTSKSNLAAVWAIENLLYGTKTSDPQFLTYEEIQDVLSNLSSVDVTDNNDGTWTINASNDIAYMIDTVEQKFGVDWSGATLLKHGTFTLRG